MWCHLCKKMFIDPQIFSEHIMKKHRLSSTFNEDTSDSEHSKQEEISDLEMNENDEIEEDNSNEEEDNSDDEDFSGGNKSHIKAVTPRRNTRVKTRKLKVTPRKNTRVKIHSKLSKSNLRTKSANNHKKLKYLQQISKQLTNYNFLRNKPASQFELSVGCLNELDESSMPNETGFDFDSENILLWLQKFKEMYKKFTLPLQSRLFDKIKTVHKEIFDNYSSAAQSNEVTTAVLKVYEELDWLIHRHIISINENL